MGANQNNGPTKGGKNAQPKAYTGAIGGRTAAARVAGNQYGDCDPATLARTVQVVASRGGALLLGCTRDGGNLAVTLFWQEQRVRFYPNSTQQLEFLLIDIEEWARQEEPDLAAWTS